VLPQLQELKLSNCQLSVQLLSLLLRATALTELEWRGVMVHSGDNTGSVLSQGEVLSLLLPQLGRLPKLSKLLLAAVGALTTADISPLSTLQRLHHLELGAGEYGLNVPEAGLMQLLAALQQLNQLQHLRLQNCALGSIKPQQQGASCQCFSALTASTQLTALYFGELRSQLLPQEAVDAMFSPGRVLPHLKVLHLSVQFGPPQRCVAAAQVAKITASCPALQELWLQNVTPRDLDLDRLVLPPGVTGVQGFH
jgi:hypothetical protein